MLPTRVIAGAMLAVIMSLPPAATAVAAEAPDAARRQEIETVVRDYLRAHPEIVLEALQEMERREQDAERAQRAAVIRGHLAELTQDPDSPVGGNPKGQVTIVEFFDYQCGYCKREAPELQKLIQADPDIRLVYKDLPILGPASTFAAQAALAAHKQGKYEALHAALMASGDRLTEQGVLQHATKLGLDTARLEKDMADPSVTAVLDRNIKLQQALGIQGTPALIVGTEFVAGAADLATLKSLVERARGK